MSDATELERLQVALEMQKMQFTKELENAQKELTRFRQSTIQTSNVSNKSISKIISSFKKIAAVGFITKFMYEFGKGAINMASQLEEVQNVVDVSFGNMAYKIENFSKRAIEAYGMSELSAKKTASMFMSMGKGMGILEEKSSNMAIELTALSGDMASFYNISQERATTALKSIYTGETEALKQYGIAMTQANLTEFARSKGINKNISDMSQAEQVTLRYMYVTQALSLANGDFARTSSSWSNQVRVLTERFKQLAAIVGSGLIQAFTPVIRVINTMISGLILLAQAISKVFGKLFGSSKAIESAGKSMSNSGAGAVDSQNALNKALKKNEGQAKKTASAMLGIDELNVLNQDSGGGSSAADDVAGGQGYDLDFSNMEFKAPDEGPIEAFAKRIEKYFKPLKEISFDKLIASIDKLKIAFGKIGKSVGAGLEWLYFKILVPLTKWTIEDYLPEFIRQLAAVLEVFNAVMVATAPLFDALWTNFLQPIASFTGGIIVEVLKRIADALYGLSDWINKNKTLFETFVVIIGSVVVAWNGFLAVMNLIHTAAMAYNTIMTLGTTITTAFGAALAFITSPIGLVVAGIAALIAIVVLLVRHWDTVKEVAKNTWNAIVDVFSQAGQWFDGHVVQPIANGFKALVNGVIGWYEGMINGMIGAFEGFINFFVKGINGIIEGVNKLSKWIGFTIQPFDLVSLGRISLPRFADGGIISGPTVGLMGEYANARSNPEIVAPLNKLKGLIHGDSSQIDNRLAILLEEQNSLLQAILNKDTSVNIDGKEVAKAIQQPQKRGLAIYSGV